MHTHIIRNIKRWAISLLLLALVWPIWLALAGGDHHKGHTDHQVFIAFGFHVNLYHSFRNDTNDDTGFGKDIRIIRDIIRTLDYYNAKGIPVKGVWDFDNLFSLQEILPQYAPDIIQAIRRRVQDHGDEVILMSYNNGLASAMTEQELNDSVRWAISNPWKSGVLDLFGRYTPIVRPQEMMTTPGNFSIYKQHGVEAVALYYSATPFDAIRAFSRELTWEEAHNPMRYHHPETQEEMVIIPTYHFGDLLEQVSLKEWVASLRDKQSSGALNRDALIFLNFDADSELWEGVDMPWALEWLPGTGGLGALVDEVQGLPGVQFTTLGHYLANHQPVSTFSFSQDTADGSFNGYNSWSEKYNTSRDWTAIERSRRLSGAAQKAISLLEASLDGEKLRNTLALAEKKRLRALSTTHFGMATPFVARQREIAMADIVRDLDGYSDQIEAMLAEGLRNHLDQHPLPIRSMKGVSHLETLLILQKEVKGLSYGRRFFKISPPAGYHDDMRLALIGSDGKVLPTVNLGKDMDASSPVPLLTLYLSGDVLTDGIYHLCALDAWHPSPPVAEGPMRADARGLANGRLTLQYENGAIEGVYLGGVRQVDAGSLLPHLKWDGRRYKAKGTFSSGYMGVDHRSANLQVNGQFHGPAGYSLSDGWMTYQFTVVDDLPYLFVRAKIHYPATQEQDWFKAGTPELMRQADLNWQEVAPAEIRFAPLAPKANPVRILKQNYLDVASAYALDYFRYDEQNLNLDNVNNHITAAYVGLVAGNSAMAIAMDTNVQSNFAFAPMRLRFHSNEAAFRVRANPFGTYHGRQVQPPTWGNGNGFDATLLAGEQFASAAPTYNGAVQNFGLMLAFFNGQTLPESIRTDLVGYAHPPVVISSHGPAQRQPAPSPPPAPNGLFAAYRNGAVHFGWENNNQGQGQYRIYCGPSEGQYDAVYEATGNGLRVTHYKNHQPFVPGRAYVATIERISASGQTSQRARPIRFVARPVKERPLKAPLALELRVLWANLRALLGDIRI